MPITRAYASAAQPGNAFLAGKNKFLNGDFGIWQRGTSFSTSDAYTADRWIGNSDATFTISRQTFTPGTAPVAGYEGQYFVRFARNAGGTYGTGSYQKIEDVRTLAGQTATLSFWAKADAAVTIAPYYNQVFGSGGSATVGAAIGSGVTLSTSWARYSITFSVPNVSGKTIGTNNYIEIYVSRYIGSSATTIDLWGVQLEAGSVATPFQTATGTLAGELAACQRYYYRQSGQASNRNDLCTGWANSTINAIGVLRYPVTMRVVPTISQSAAADYTFVWSAGASTITGVAYDMISADSVNIRLATTGLTTGQGGLIAILTGTTKWFEASAEL